MMPRAITDRFRERLAAQHIEMRFELRTLGTVFGELANVIDMGFAQLNDGHYVWTPLDCAELCRQLQAVVALDLRVEQDRLSRVCHACGHEHLDRECGKDMGGAGVCKCDVEVRA